MNLNDKAILVTLNISAWDGYKYDKDVTRKVVAQHKAAYNAGRWSKNLMPVSVPAFRAIGASESRARAIYHRETLPWSDDNGGWRILPSANYFNFTTAIRNERDTFFHNVKEFKAVFPTLAPSLKIALNGMYREEDYPAPDEIENLFDFKVRHMPVPSSGHILIDLSATEVDMVREQVEEEVKNNLHKVAMKDAWNRLYDGIVKFQEVLTSPTAKVKNQTLEAVQDLCELLRRLNVTGSKELDDTCRSLEITLLGLEPKDLNKSKAERNRTRKEVERLQNDLAAFMS